MNGWEAIFLQSRVNDGYYNEDELPQKPWQWPATTWFRARLEGVREQTAFSRGLRSPGREDSPELN
jgi:hypothetical protein